MSEVVKEDEQQPTIDKYTTAAAVAHAISGQPLEFEKATQHILAAKVQDAIAGRREEVANRMFGVEPENEVEESEPEPEAEEPDVEDETPEET